MTSAWKPRTLILQHEAPTPPGLMTGWLHDQDAKVDVGSDESMDASDPTAASQPGQKDEPVPSSGFPE